MPARKKFTPDEGPTPAKKPRSRKKPEPPAETAAAVTKASSRRRSVGRPTGRPNGPDLIIVESPAKAKTIHKYLGGNFKVLASYGHVRDLPPKGKKKNEEVVGIDIAAGWQPRYQVIERSDGDGKGKRRSAQDILNELAREAAKANRIFLATDPDREGESIAWHLEQALGLDESRTYRITFNEITKSAVQHAVANPGKIDPNRVQAQEARRVLDRVVGYPLSNLLGAKVTRGLSAGRVQSVAVKLIVDREREIEAFRSDEYWKITTVVAPQGLLAKLTGEYVVTRAKAKKKGEAGDGPDAPAEEKEKKPRLPEGAFPAELVEWNGAKFAAGTEAEARAVAERLDRAAYVVGKIEQKDQAQRPQPPFTTSTLQQQANLRMGFSASRTMQTAQKLYEGVDLGGEGPVALITYMRTDSTRVSDDALAAVRKQIEAEHGPRYLPATPNRYASGKSAQEAHEAVRPTDVTITPARAARMGLAGDQLKLYILIYNRFVASQMTPAVFAVTNVEIIATADADAGLFKTQGRVLKFDGYRKVMPPGGKQEDALLPELTAGQPLDRLSLTASQHFTEPPPRYNEASLVKALEKEGIGRPSTYATIISTIQKRGYVEQKDRRFFATAIGKVVTDLLVQHFPRIMDLKFTSHFEEELDEIERGKCEYRQVLNEFWGPFSEALTKAKSDMPSQKGQETGAACPKCGKPLVRQFSKKTGGDFVGCSGWKDDPPCKYIQPREGEEAAAAAPDVACPNCGRPMIQRFSRRGPFLGCSGYPDCKTTMNLTADGGVQESAKPTEHTCDKCGKPMVLRQGRRGPFLACTGYPACKNAQEVDADGKPIRLPDPKTDCEKCGQPMVLKKGPRGYFLSCMGYPKCRGAKPLPPELREQIAAIAPPPAKKAELPAVAVTETCGECGAAMKVRQGRTGFFLGCSKYPKCRGTKPLPAEVLEQMPQAG